MDYLVIAQNGNGLIDPKCLVRCGDVCAAYCVEFCAAQCSPLCGAKCSVCTFYVCDTPGGRIPERMM